MAPTTTTTRPSLELDTRRGAPATTPADLEAQGWARFGSARFPGDSSLRVLVFKRDGCTRTLVV